MNERNSNYWLSRVHTLLKAKVLTLGGLDLNTLQFSAYIPFKTFGCQRLFLDSFQFRSSLLPKAVAKLKYSSMHEKNPLVPMVTSSWRGEWRIKCPNLKIIYLPVLFQFFLVLRYLQWQQVHCRQVPQKQMLKQSKTATWPLCLSLHDNDNNTIIILLTQRVLSFTGIIFIHATFDQSIIMRDIFHSLFSWCTKFLVSRF